MTGGPYPNFLAAARRPNHIAPERAVNEVPADSPGQTTRRRCPSHGGGQFDDPASQRGQHTFMQGEIRFELSDVMHDCHAQPAQVAGVLSRGKPAMNSLCDPDAVALIIWRQLRPQIKFLSREERLHPRLLGGRYGSALEGVDQAPRKYFQICSRQRRAFLAIGHDWSVSASVRP